MDKQIFDSINTFQKNRFVEYLDVLSNQANQITLNILNGPSALLFSMLKFKHICSHIITSLSAPRFMAILKPPWVAKHGRKK